MNKLLIAAVAIIPWAPAFAADMPYTPVAYAEQPQWNWSGAYFGVHVGGGLGSTRISDPRGPGIYGGSVRTPAPMVGGQAGYNWQPSRKWVVGVEADISSLKGDGTDTCLAISGYFLSANCRVKQDALATVTGRVGIATGPQGKTLFYAKGGGAWLRERIDIATNPLVFATSSSGSKWGWTAGVGVEQAIAPAWTVKMEYDYAGFGSSSLQTPASYLQVRPPSAFGYVATPGGSASASQAIQTVKVGVNMKFGGDAYARWDGLDDYSLRGAQRAEERPMPRGEIEIGGRVWYSSGRFQKDLGATTDQKLQSVLVSRLTYNSDAASGELFARVEGPHDVFLKGFVGGGTLLSGKMNDEDWLIFNQTVPYSNTASDPVKGSIGYATIDAGYSFFRGNGFNVGAFVGYNYYSENKKAYGCRQIANQNSDCVPQVSSATLGITEDDKWNSLRLGLNGVVMVTDRLKLTADAAYLPYVSFRGTDNHLLRTDVANTVSPESGNGQGVQLETILSYAVTRSFNIGAGGRYWAMWATNDAKTNIFGTDCPCQTQPVRTERYGGFLEASYKFDPLR